MTDYLIEQGHKKIAFIRGSSKTRGSRLRYEGFKDSISSYKIEDKCVLVDAKETTEEAGYSATLDLIKNKVDIDAIFYSSDDMAVGGISALNECGIRIPEDMSIVGYNNSELSKYTKPALTTVMDNIDMPAQSAKLLIKALKNENIEEKVIKGDTIIVIRDSVQRR